MPEQQRLDDVIGILRDQNEVCFVVVLFILYSSAKSYNSHDGFIHKKLSYVYVCMAWRMLHECMLRFSLLIVLVILLGILFSTLF